MHAPTLVTVALALGSLPASADPPRYKRKHELTIDVRQSDRTRPVHAAPARPQQPTLGGETVLLLELAKSPIRKEQEQLLEQLVRDTPDDDPDKPDLLFRLAEHYASQLRLWRLEEIRLELKH